LNYIGRDYPDHSAANQQKKLAVSGIPAITSPMLFLRIHAEPAGHGELEVPPFLGALDWRNASFKLDREPRKNPDSERTRLGQKRLLSLLLIDPGLLGNQ